MENVCLEEIAKLFKDRNYDFMTATEKDIVHILILS